MPLGFTDLMHTLFSRALSVLLLLSFVSVGCDSSDEPVTPSPPPTATTGTVSGQLTLVPGAPGSVGNTRSALYSSISDYVDDRVVCQVAATADGSYSIGNIVPETYCLDAWKVSTGNGAIDGGDLYDVNGTITTSGPNLTPVPVSAGSNVTVSFRLEALERSIRLLTVAKDLDFVAPHSTQVEQGAFM